LILALSACSAPSAEQARPALWEVESPNGERGWLFGTIHALTKPVALDSPAYTKALGAADVVVMEVAAIDDDTATAAIFARLARTPGQLPLDQRIAPDLVSTLDALLRKHGMAPEGFSELETWAAALTLNHALQAETGSDSGNGIDRLVLRQRGQRPVRELEGAEAQLAIFDRLAEADQRELLAEVVQSAEGARAEALRLERIWKAGDVSGIAAMTREGLLADPELREALLVGRNRVWTDQLAPMIAAGDEPFVAVGAMHLAGPDGLPVLLQARGFKVRRLQ
jgi:uncharacterized protein YbaP (TraB family)